MKTVDIKAAMAIIAGITGQNDGCAEDFERITEAERAALMLMCLERALSVATCGRIGGIELEKTADDGELLTVALLDGRGEFLRGVNVAADSPGEMLKAIVSIANKTGRL